MKQPRITVAPWRQLIRPVSIMKPTVATAITAMTVAIVPRSVPSSHRTADTSTPEPAGSATSCACAEAAWNRPAITPAPPILLLFPPPLSTPPPAHHHPTSTPLQPPPPPPPPHQ